MSKQTKMMRTVLRTKQTIFRLIVFENIHTEPDCLVYPDWLAAAYTENNFCFNSA